MPSLAAATAQSNSMSCVLAIVRLTSINYLECRASAKPIHKYLNDLQVEGFFAHTNLNEELKLTRGSAETGCLPCCMLTYKLKCRLR